MSIHNITLVVKLGMSKTLIAREYIGVLQIIRKTYFCTAANRREPRKRENPCSRQYRGYGTDLFCPSCHF